MTPFFLGESKCIKELESMAAALAGSGLPVLLEGEGGTGKETLARHLHDLSGGPGEFLRLYCGQPVELEQARVSGARTLFLKHVHLLTQAAQDGLLRALQASEGGPLAGVRLISSVNDSPERRIARGEFSADLYFRLSACRLTAPPLRQRPEDIGALFRALLPAENGHGRIDPKIEQALVAYSWPGNLRELESLARSYTLAPDSERLIEELARRAEALRGGRPRSDGHPSLREQVRQAALRVESEIILKTLEQHHWNRRRAARTLKISYRGLLYRMKACQLHGNALEGVE